MVQLTQIDSTPGDDALETAIQTRLGDLDSGKYRANNQYVLRLFANWLRYHRDIDSVKAITDQDLREWSRALREALDDDQAGIGTGSTAEQYYAYVSAFLGWAVRDGLLDRNPARSETALEPLPESDASPSRQFWTQRERNAICATADRLVDDSFDSEADRDRLQAYRDRALLYTLAYTGCRGAELAAVDGDPKRNGIQWSDIDLDVGIAWVYGKTREREESPILDQAISPLRRWKQVLDPPADRWPVFPTSHLPTLYGALPEDASPSPDTVWDDLREHDVQPPALKVAGVRTVLKRLCEQSEYEFEEVLKPHGGRRGLGDQLYTSDPTAAQETLRHKDIKTTHEAYRERRTEQVKQRADEILDESGE